MDAFLGVSPETFAGTRQAFLQLVHPEDRATIEDAIDGALVGEGGFAVDIRTVRPDGTVRWALAKAQAHHDEAGQPRSLVGVNLDITERKEAEEALRRSEEHFRTLVEAFPGLVWMADADGGNQRFGARWNEYSGQSFDPAVEHSWLDAVDPDQRADVAAAWGEAMASGQPYESEVRYRRNDGVFRWFLISAVPIRDHLGRIHWWYGTSVDIDDRKRAEEERQQYVSLVENSPEFVGIASLDGQLTHLNPAGRRLVGLPHGPIATMDLTDLASPETASLLREQALPAALRTGHWEDEGQLRHRTSGALIEVEMSVMLIRDLPGGKPLALALIFRDIRERRVWDRLREEFFGAVSHDLKNPIAVIAGQTQLLQRQLRRADPIDTGRLDSGLNAIASTAARLAGQIDELVDLAQLQLGQPLALRLARTDLVDLVHRSIAEHQASTQRHRIRLETELPQLVGSWDQTALAAGTGEPAGQRDQVQPARRRDRRHARPGGGGRPGGSPHPGSGHWHPRIGSALHLRAVPPRWQRGRQGRRHGLGAGRGAPDRRAARGPDRGRKR